MIFEIKKYMEDYYIATAQNIVSGKRYVDYGRSHIEALNNLFAQLQAEQLFLKIISE